MPDSDSDQAAIFDPVSRRFDGVRLRRAILGRGATIQEVRLSAGLAHGTMRRALRGQPVRDETAVAIYRILADREPLAVF